MNGEVPAERIKKTVKLKVDFLTMVLVCCTIIIVAAIMGGTC